MSTSPQTMVEAINQGMEEARAAMAKATAELANLRTQRDELYDTLRRLASQANDACGVMSEYVAMPAPSLRDKFPTTIARMTARVREANFVIANATDGTGALAELRAELLWLVRRIETFARTQTRSEPLSDIERDAIAAIAKAEGRS